MRASLCVLWLLSTSWACAYTQSVEDSFTEHVDIVRLSDTHVQLSLRLQQTHTLSPGTPPTTFPLAVYLLAAATPLHHLELHLTRGRWDYQAWGAPSAAVEDTVQPPGAAVSVVWRPPSLATHAQHWTRLQHRLAGLLCASLNLAAQPHAAPPLHMACLKQPTAAGLQAGVNSSAACMDRHMAWLPREAICTENLTPWLQLLPCRGLAGLSGLLANRQLVLGGDYHSMSLELEVIPPLAGSAAHSSQQQPSQLVLTQRFTTVLRTKPGSDNQAILLSKLLPAVKSLSHCTAAVSSTYAVHPQPSSKTAGNNVEATAGSAAVSDDTSLVQPLGVCPSCVLQEVVLPAVQPAQPPAVLLQAALHGAGLYTGTLVIAIQQLDAARIAPAKAWPEELRPWSSTADTHSEGSQHDPEQAVALSSHLTAEASKIAAKTSKAHAEQLQGSTAGSSEMHAQQSQGVHSRTVGSSATHSSPADSYATDSWGVVCLQQWVPWVLRVWLHTLQLQINNQVVPNWRQELLLWQAVSPAQDRGRPLLLSTCLRLPPDVQQARLSASVSRTFLTLAEHPPDAHRGWDVPPPILTYLETGTSHSKAELQRSGADQQQQSGAQLRSTARHLRQVVGPGLLVRLPTADVAMPYNVICLTSTVLAVFLGAALNTLLRRSSKAEPASTQSPPCEVAKSK